MSHIWCKCGSNEHIIGYGFAGGVFGGYTICNICGHVLELFPDTDGMTDEQAEAARKAARDLTHPTPRSEPDGK